MAFRSPARLTPAGASSGPDAGALLHALAAELQARPLGPSADFRDGLRSRLLAVAAVQQPAPSRSALADRATDWARSWRGQRALGAATAGLAGVALVAGAGIAGSRSLPGDPFYAVKRGSEHVQLALTSGDVERGKKHLQFAVSRLHEVEQLTGSHVPAPGAGAAVTASEALGGSRSSRVRTALDDMQSQIGNGARLLTRAYETHQDATALRALDDFSRTQASRLTDVLPNLDGQEQPPAIEALSLVFQVETQTAVLLGVNPLAPPAGGDTPYIPPFPVVVPTPAPSASPTPSGAPSVEPPTPVTPAPSETASPTPSAEPSSAAPTDEPSAQPTSSEQPSQAPTDDPTAQPTPAPAESAAPGPQASGAPSTGLLARLLSLLPSWR